MAILNKYYTTWTSDDSQMYKLEIIPSHTANDAVDTINSGFVNVQLPNDFLLKDMAFEASLGDIPLGIATQTLKVAFNLGADGTGVADFAVFINSLLRGTDSKGAPVNSANAIVGTSDFQFDCFNAVILSRSDNAGSTYNPIFIGCQKYAAENELQLTKLSPIINYSVEFYDIGRCIGEFIKPITWFYYLRCKHELVNYGSQCTNLQYEDKQYTALDIAYHFGEQPSYYNYLLSYYNYNRFPQKFSYKIQTLRSFITKMDTMYSDHMCAILCSSVNFYFEPYNQTMLFTTLKTPSIAGTSLNQYDDVCIVSEVNLQGFSDPEFSYIYGNCIGGILKDVDGFGQYTNFHEVLNNILENFLFKGTQTYAYSGGSYSCEVRLETMISNVNSQFTVQQSTVFDSIKFKMFNETLNTCKAVVSNVKGDRDTTDWTYSKQATSGDNSKDVKLLFHNLPLLTNSYDQINDIFNPPPPERIRIDANKTNIRNTINAGNLVYLSEDEIVRKVDTDCKVRYRPSTFLNKKLAIDRNQSFEQQVITEQQYNGMPLNICYAIVYAMSQIPLKILEFTTTSKPNANENLRGIEPINFGYAVTISYANLNTILGSWDPPSPAISSIGTIISYNLDIYSGMVDVKILAHGEPVNTGGVIPGEG